MPRRPQPRARSRWASAAVLVLPLALLGTAWFAGYRPGSVVDAPPSRSLVNIVDTTALTTPAPTRNEAAATRAGRDAQTQGLMVAADPAWLTRTAKRTGIPPVALRAYGRASILEATARPGCHVGWATLAAIGEVESAHGRIGGARLLADGRTSRPIVGPALDGEGGMAAIRPDPDGARLHGDNTWEHAVGPMQFLPGSWRTFGADADGDGDANPSDIDDAAWGTARHLCSGGLDLRDGLGWTRAVLRYNASDAYVRKVYEVAEAYARSAAKG
ncbi:lytic murein transglycosylase [Terrabacter carboxydivorans]|uniref:Lytic murein transglycosylase n=1 Tax=Terrabacter carboxydivorans TaxID=619730 RepID=A0ABN3LM55_9MICO